MNIYDALEKIKFEEECDRYIKLCKRDSMFYTEKMLVTNFVFSIIQKFHSEILNEETAKDANEAKVIEG